MDMEVEGPQTPYEVFCQRCQVSFPVGTRQCIHCGGRVGRERWIRPPSAASPTRQAEQARQARQEEEIIEEIGEDEMPRGRFLSPFTVLWLLLAMAGALYRQCA